MAVLTGLQGVGRGGRGGARISLFEPVADGDDDHVVRGACSWVGCRQASGSLASLPVCCGLGLVGGPWVAGGCGSCGLRCLRELGGQVA
jgi:hypothetical protein